VGLPELIQQPDCRIGRQRLIAAAAKAESYESVRGPSVHAGKPSARACYAV